MKQRINLYQGSLRPQQEAWGFDRVVQGLLGLLLVLGAYSAWLGFDAYQSSQALAQEQTQQHAQQNTLAELEAVLSQQEQQSILNQAVAQAEQRIAFYQRLGQQLGEPNQSQSRFSSYLEGLAKQRVEGAWLTRIELAKGGEQLAIEGESLAPDHVPQLLLQMKSEPVFAGRTFAELSMQRQTESVSQLTFSIRSHIPEDQDGR